VDYNTEKVDEIALALLFLSSFEEYGAMRAWKGIAWDVLNRLHEKKRVTSVIRRTRTNRWCLPKKAITAVKNCL
jgi:hypothetical protein